MSSQTILVTGATDGIGRQAALELARQGARVLLHGRDERRGRAALEAIRRASGNDALEFLQADFASLGQVRALAADVRARHPRLDVVIHNAGVFMRERRLSQDGFELTWAVNHLAPFLLNALLVDTLQRSAPARVVTVSSATHQRAQIDFDDLQAERRYDGYRAYAASKLANVLFAFELAERLRGSGVTSNALHPGVIDTKLLRAGFGAGGAGLAEGAATPVYLAASMEIANVTGRYFVDQREAPASPAAHDQALRRRLWGVSERAVGLNTGPAGDR